MEKKSSEQENSSSCEAPKESNDDMPAIPSEFTSEEIELFETRFANGYDLFIDSKYVSWLQQCHPDSLPVELQIGTQPSPEDTNASILPTVDMHSTPIRSAEKPLTMPSPAVTPIAHEPLEGPSSSHSELNTLSASPDSLSTSLRSTRETISAVTQFLTIPSSTIKSSSGKGKGKGKGKSVSGARVLTSEDSLALMEEKEKT